MRKNSKLWRRLLNYFLRGLMVLLPIALTVGIIYWFLGFVAGILGLKITANNDLKLFFFYFVIGITVITTIGYFVKEIVAKQILDFVQGIVDKAPGLKFIFGTTRDITEAFVGENKKFTLPVLVFVSEGIHKLGFLTAEDATVLNLPNSSVVYFPYSYGINGEMMLVENTRIQKINFEASQVTKFVVSGGAVPLS